MHVTPFTLSLSIWVPLGANRTWAPCPLLSDAMSEELINACGELRSVLGAQGRLISRLLSAPQVPKYDGFRIIGRRADTGLLVASTEWQRSPETHELVWFPMVWTSCEYAHPNDQQLVA